MTDRVLELPRSRISLFSWPLAICVASLVVGFATLWDPFGLDQGIHATIAAALLDGQVTYRDVYNIKPPLTTALHALSQAAFGQGQMAIRILDLIAVTAASVGLFHLVDRLGHGRLAGGFAALTYVGLYAKFDFWNRAQTDGWAAMLLIATLLLVERGWRTRSAPAMAAAGAVLAAAFALKYTVAGLGIVIFAPLLMRQVAFRWRDAAAFIAGGAAFLAVLAAGLAAVGALGPFLEIQAFVLGYVSGFPQPQSMMVQTLVDIAMTNPVALLPMLLGLAVVLRGVIAGDRAAVVTVAFAFAALLSYWAQMKSFYYHAHAVALVMAILAGTGGAVIFRAVSDRFEGTVAAVAIAAVFAAVIVSGKTLRAPVAAVSALIAGEPVISSPYGRLPDAPNYVVADVERAAAALNAELRPGDTLFVWGYATTLYFHSGRLPIHRYPYSWPFVQRVADPALQADLMARLTAAPPDVIVVGADDVSEWVTGNPHDSREVLLRDPALSGFLTGGYRLVESVPSFDIWRRAAP